MSDPPDDGSRVADERRSPITTIPVGPAVAGDNPGAERTGPLAPGSSVGRYTVLDRIGAGGMGIVYAAFDPQLDRRVALKLMHPLAHPTGERVGSHTRLLREAQSMAKLSHPNVITVHDVGTFGDRVFVAMEFIDGVTMRDWLHETERTWEDVVDAFVRAGRGLAAAHAAGLVHRDFKPDNVLMGTDGRVLVMDFGIARQASARTHPSGGGMARVLTPPRSPEDPAAGGPDAIADMDLTRTGAMLGTPAYMAPEQHAGGRVGPPADQFSFCVALYEGLYGERPFDGASVTSLAMNVLEGRVRSAPRDTRVPGWLREVLTRGLERDIDDRYPSMDALLAELQRDPPQILRPGVVGGVAAAVAGLVTLVYFASRPPTDDACEGSTDLLGGVWDTERRDALASAIRNSPAPYASASASEVLAQLDAHTAAWLAAHDDRCEVRQSVRKTGATPASADPVMVCLSEQLEPLRALTSRLEEADAATISRAVTAAHALRRPKRCLETGTHSESAPTMSPALAQAWASRATGHPEHALVVAATALDAARSADAQALAAGALLVSAEADLDLGRVSSARSKLHDAVFAAAQTGRADLEARCWSLLGELEGMEGGPGAATGRSLVLAARVAAHRSDDPDLGVEILVREGAMELAGGRFAQALEAFDRALPRGSKRRDEPWIALAEQGAGLALAGLGLYADAIVRHGNALAARERLFGAQHPQVGLTLVDLAASMHADGQLDAAEAALVRAQMMLEPKPWGSRTPPSAADGLIGAQALDQLGLLRRAQERFADATTLHTRALALTERTVGLDHRDAGYPAENLALSLADQGRHLEALPHLRRALALWANTLPPDHPDLGIAYLNLANSLYATHDLDAAEQHFLGALNVWEQALTVDHPLLSYALTGLGRMRLEQGDPAQAAALLERAFEIRNHEDEDRLNVAETAWLLGRSLHAADRDPARALDLMIVARENTGAFAPVDAAGQRRVLAGEPVLGFTDQLDPAGLGVSNHRLLESGWATAAL